MGYWLALFTSRLFELKWIGEKLEHFQSLCFQDLHYVNGFFIKRLETVVSNETTTISSSFIRIMYVNGNAVSVRSHQV